MVKLQKIAIIAGLSAVCCAPLAAGDKAVAQYAAAEISVQKESGKMALPGFESPAKPAPIIPVWGAQTGAAESEWTFLKAAAQENDKDVLKMVLPQLEDWLARNPEHSAAGDAQLLKAKLHEQLGDYKFALMDLLKCICLYPQSDSFGEAGKMFGDLLAKKGDKKTRTALELAASAPETTAADYNLSAMLRKLSGQAGREYYEPLLAEYRYFFNRFPSYPGNDVMRLSLAGLHELNRKYLAARLSYEEMIHMHPSSPLLASAKLSLADTFEEKLKEYDRAIEVYRDITVSFPGTGEAWAAYGRLPVLAEKRKKYDLAVETYEKIIGLYPEKEEAYEAYQSEARLLREKLGKPQAAVDVLNRLADKYKSEKAIDALLLAAEIYRKDLKDAAGEVEMYERIASEYPKDPEAPKALYASGEIFYKAKEKTKAREYYQKVMDLYPAAPQAKKAAKRVAAIITGRF